MTDFDPLLDRATRRLSADPELQLEVRCELRTHLAESVGEHAAAGAADPDAAAVAALGDADALADQLFAANGRRLRHRRALRWAVGVGVVPVLTAAAVALALGPMRSLGVIASMASGWVPHVTRNDADPISARLAGRALGQFEAGLSPAARRLVTITARADPDDPDHVTAAVATAAAWAAADPRDPVARATRAVHLVACQWRDRDGKLDTWAPSTRPVLDVLAADQGVEPDNGLYPLLRSAVLIDASIRYGDHFGADLNGGFARGPWQFRIQEVHVTDPATFAAGMAALHEAATRPRYAAHQSEVAAALAAAVPLPTDVGGRLIRQDLVRQVLWSCPSGSVATSWAAGRAVVGDVAAAGPVVADLRALARRLATAADVGPWTAVVAGGFATDADGLEAVVARRLGHVAEFDRLCDRAVKVTRAQQAVMRAGLIDADPRETVALAGQASVAGWVAMLAVAVAVSAGPAAGVRVTTGRWPAAISLPWPASALWGVAAAAPAAGYVAWLAVSGPSTDGWFWQNVDAGLVAVAMAVVLRWGVLRAVRRRAVTLGRPTLAAVPFGRGRIVLGVALVAIGIAASKASLLRWTVLVDQNHTIALALWAYAVATAVLPVEPRGEVGGRPLTAIATGCLVLLAATAIEYAAVDDWRQPSWVVYLQAAVAVSAGVVLLACGRRLVTLAARPTSPVRFSAAWAAVPALSTAAVVLALGVGLPERVRTTRFVDARFGTADPAPAVAAVADLRREIAGAADR